MSYSRQTCPAEFGSWSNRRVTCVIPGPWSSGGMLSACGSGLEVNVDALGSKEPISELAVVVPFDSSLGDRDSSGGGKPVGLGAAPMLGELAVSVSDSVAASVFIAPKEGRQGAGTARPSELGSTVWPQLCGEINVRTTSTPSVTKHDLPIE